MSATASPAAALLFRSATAIMRHGRSSGSTPPRSNASILDNVVSSCPAVHRLASSSSHTSSSFTDSSSQRDRPAGTKRDMPFSVRTPRPRQPRGGQDASSRHSGRGSNWRDTGRSATRESGPLQYDRPPGPVRDAIISLRASMVSLDIDAVWNHWQRLEELGATHRLSNRDHAELIKLCTSRIHPPTSAGSPDVQRKEWDERCWRWASFAARAGNAQIVAGWARLAIVAGKLDLVDALAKLALGAGKERQIDGHHVEEAGKAAREGAINDVGTEEAAVHSRCTGEPQADAKQAPAGSKPNRISNVEKQAALHDLLACLVVSKAIRDDLKGLVDAMGKLEIGSVFTTYFKPDKVSELAKDILRNLRARERNAARPAPRSTPDSVSASPSSTGHTCSGEMHVLRVRVERFTTHAELARCRSAGPDSSRRIARLLGSLFSSRRPDAAWSIFEAAMEAVLDKTAPWLVVQTGKAEPAARDSDRLATWTDSCWSVCLSGFLASGKPDLALSVWSKYHELGLEPTQRIWNALLDGYSRAKNYEAAIKTWEQITAAPLAVAAARKPTGNSAAVPAAPTVTPDATMYTTMISVYFKNRQPDAAQRLFEQMRLRSDSSSDGFSIPTETCNAIIYGLCLNGQTAEAQAVLDQMEERGPQPTIGTINALLRAHGRSGDLASLAGALRTIDRLKLEPDVVTFTTVLDTLLRKGGDPAGDSVRKLLTIMDEMGVRANAVTYTALIKACLVGSEALNVDMTAESMFLSHHRRGGSASGQSRGVTAAPAAPAAASVSAAAAATSSSTTVSDPRIDAALNLLDRMIKMRIQPTEVTYTALIGAVLQHPHVVAYSFSQHHIPSRYAGLPRPLKELEESEATLRSWKEGTPDVCLSLVLLDKMRERGLSPNSTTYHYLIAGLARPVTDRAAFVRALSLMDEMVSLSSTGRTSKPATQTGPFVASVLRSGDSVNIDAAARDSGRRAMMSYANWVVILSTLSDRLEFGVIRQPEQRSECARALAIALELMQSCGADELKGSDGGTALVRIAGRARSLLRSLRL